MGYYLVVLQIILLVFFCFCSSTWAVNSKYVVPQSNGTLRYVPYNDKGDIMMDFSRVGYRQGDAPIPDVPVITRVKPVGNKASDVANIQRAINSMASQPVNASTGFRGAVLLEPGEYNITSTIFLNVSGVVLRGSGRNSTVLYGSAKKVYNLIVAGNDSADKRAIGSQIRLTGYIKVGTTKLNVTAANTKFRVGDHVLVAATKNLNWIKTNGMDKLISLAPSDRRDGVENWEPFDSLQPRVITAVNETSITLDVPLIESIDPQWGGGYVTAYKLLNNVTHVGVEDLCSYSYFNPKITETNDGKSYYSDENHAERLVAFYGVIDGFARRICGKYFNHFVSAEKYSKRITISQAEHSDPVSILDGRRRYTFYIERSSQILYEHCRASGARHAFVFGARSTGPNVFYNCSSKIDYVSSEPHHRWSVGGLYDNCNATIAIQNRLYYGGGHGWGGANFVAWNTQGTLQLHSPVTDWNFAVGHVGVKQAPTFVSAPGGVDRSWESYGTHVQPKSLYLAQLADRR